MEEQPALDGDTAAEACQRSVCTNNAVAGNDNTDGVASVREADRTRLVRVPKRRGELAIRQGTAVRNFLKQRPDRLLKGGSLRCQRQVERAATAPEVFVELCLCRIEDIELDSRARGEIGNRTRSLEKETGEGVRTRA